MTADTVKLLAAVARRLTLKEGEEKVTGARQSNTVRRGIDLTKIVDAESSPYDHVRNMVKDMVYAAEGGAVQRDNVYGNILRQLEAHIRSESYSKAQVYIELQQELEFNCWRVLVDIPHPETKGVLVRHYITGHQYYAFPITFISRDPEIIPVAYNLFPVWTSQEVFTDVTVNFDTKTIYHAFHTLSNPAALGIYVCDMDGNVRNRYEPGAVPQEVRNAL
jgi:hypothetical protein